MSETKKPIGVFVCHCGINIAGTVDVKEVVRRISEETDVAVVLDHQYCCSDPGQNLIKETIKKYNLEKVVVACCSPTLHENTFRKAVSEAGINPYNCEIANIREQCSWVTEDRKKATQKAVKIIKTIIAKVADNEPLVPIKVSVNRRALVIGGGVAGIQAALDIANAGYPVILLDKNPSIGGHMSQLSETFPTLDCSQCILTPKMVEVKQHPLINLLTYAEVEEVSGYVGNFKVKVRKKAKFVDWERCTGCDICVSKCPKKVSDEFNCGLSTRKVIYKMFPQAVPNRVVIDKENCLYFTKGACRLCEKHCPFGAVKFDDQDQYETLEVGAIVLATGYELIDRKILGSYGYGQYQNVIDGLQFERLLSASGPYMGEVRRPSDGEIPRTVVFVQCAGSRDPENAMAYCSKICCMYTAKQAILYKHRVHDGEAIVFYIDVRTGGKGFEEFYKRATDEGVLYIRGKVSKIFEQGKKVIVWGVDTLTGKKVEVEADLVVLATAMRPAVSKEWAQIIKVAQDEYGWFTEAHPKLRPVETLSAGFYLAGACQGPKDIPEAVAQASGAASKVISLFTRETLEHTPTIAGVVEELCSGCAICVDVCPYKAREIVIKDDKKKKAKVIEVLCEGCGACSAACPTGAAQQKNFTDRQIENMVKAGLE
ncbi:MAG: CoB--CoM heterodisulfide reductase iron-sulfur subunit A family protein [candidate division WOR-3 bacterium]|nr:CoB--CoM heterodisulfide reductase iron-sulfur subunit A family protein [candidate division WOR-3 bacterium]MCX7756724.1 CoB--CoM heterodisulfide reductase iron-sulfur subunit A family protein [candidate division WOR-3 bacterium]MDW7987408.1 CoB--CoM heterodisulfide reductase iron-sulfur subunit A family protein [candidate division WOR-3 bacterium]